jgi:hypothetical protein
MAAPSKSAGNRMRCCRASCRYPLSRHSPDFDSRRPSIARQAYWTRLNRLARPHTATFAHGRTMVAGLRGSAGLAGYCRYVPGVREICIDRVSNLIRIPAWSLRLGALDSPVEERRFEPSVPLAAVSLDDRGGEGAAGRSRAGGHRSLGPRPIRPQLAPLRASGNAASPTRPPSDTARPSCPSGSSAVATG